MDFPLEQHSNEESPRAPVKDYINTQIASSDSKGDGLSPTELPGVDLPPLKTNQGYLNMAMEYHPPQ